MNKDNHVSPIVFVNNPISDAKDDVIGFSSQVETIKNAVKNGATMIGLIADYGTGKSSMTKILKNEYTGSDYPEPININMWDSLSESTNPPSHKNESVSVLTKSFLFQLANGHDRRLGSYVNKLLSKNYGTISFATNHFRRVVFAFFGALLFFVLYKISGASGTGIMQFLPNWAEKFASFYKLLSPLLLFLAVILIFYGIKDICIAFSHWKMPESKSPEINDVFDIYRIIIDESMPKKDNKQLVFIDDLDRIDDKETVIYFLKELYRFQDSICEDESKFVFIVSVMPESKLLNEKSTNESTVFSKIFDATIYLKPIHFDDYDSILFDLINNNPKSKKTLEQLMGQKINSNLPTAFRWIKRGSNLTLRDLKGRLNHAVSIMVSLWNKSYAGNSAANFEACAAIAYLESQHPNDYYKLIENEAPFANFMKCSLPIINVPDEKNTEKLKVEFSKNFSGQEFSTQFIHELCAMIADGVFNDDFRMYFYTYPQGRHIKTTSEREICDFILFPNLNTNYDSLKVAVAQAYMSGDNITVNEQIKACETYPLPLLKDDTLFEKAADISIDKLFNVFKKTCFDGLDFKDDDLEIWKRMSLLKEHQKNMFVKRISNTICALSSVSAILHFRDILITTLGDNLLDFKDVFVSKTVPLITKEEIEKINNPRISIELIDSSKISIDDYEYIKDLILSEKLIDISADIFKKALLVFRLYFRLYYNEIKKPVSNDTLCFLKINHYIHDETFKSIYNDIDDASLVDYINQFTLSEISNEYLVCLNNKCILSGLSDELIKRMVENDLFVTPLCHLSQQNALNKFDLFDTKATQIINATQTINNKYPDVVLEIREKAYEKSGSKLYLSLYREPYKTITEEEFLSIKDSNKAILTIDTDRIEEDDFAVLNILYKRSYTKNSLFNLFEYLFDSEGQETAIADNDLKSELLGKIDFSALNFKSLSFDQRQTVFNLIKDCLPLSGSEMKKSFLKKLDCFVPELEETIQSDDDYEIMIQQFDELSELSIQWLSKHYISCELSENLCKILYQKGDYENYIIANSLRESKLAIDNTIPAESYINVYEKVKNMFYIMSNNMDFLEIFQLQAEFEDFDMEHIIPAFRAIQHKRFFEYIDTLDSDDKSTYFKTFGKLASLDDSKAFRRMVCKDENMKLIGDYDTYIHIKEQLWEDDRADKGVFTRVWNRQWKNQSNENIEFAG